MSPNDTEVVGNGATEVLRLLEARRHDGLAERLDGRKVGLVVEGGGMRGVLSAGSLLALDLLGYRECFDSVFAASAGSVNAAYFLSGQGAIGISVYFDDISNRRFINPARFWKIADVDYVYDHIVPTVKPLDQEAIRRCRQEFYVTATEVLSGNNVVLDAKSRIARVSSFLKASSALPILYNRAVAIGDKSYMDGGISGGVPVDWAAAYGCTDILVLLSRPCSYVSGETRAIERILFWTMLGRKYPALYEAYLQSPTAKLRSRRLAVGLERKPNVNIATICPDEITDGVNRTTTSRRKLVEGAYFAGRKVFQMLDKDSSLLNETFRRFR